ncbi:MAG: LysE family translocator [Paludibacter sp.]|jgi:threonine/homoserine/homoserine lactone efflux protein|nr:LysE family transporter [Bacteroidales bacterium]HOG04682.1 LysE family transporter [Paludibacter sp.]HOS44994.1 LysE family transporter [Paludibacter sp.]HPM09169.1 LysE family transporter [Paludibacter sp.]
MLDTVIKGIIIGLFVSVPMGPIGMLIIQRTLDRGRKYGIATGLGATLSDLIYTVIGLFFIGFVVDFIEENKIILQVIGSVVVFLFGVFIYKNKPQHQLQHQQLPKQQNNGSIVSDFFSSLVLTLSNPFILFVLLALFARFNFLAENTTLYHNIIGMLSILAGALSWWLVLTYLVNKSRSKLSYRSINLINQIIGLIIMLIGVVGTALSLLSFF